MEPSKIRIPECPRCGQTHEVEITPYRLSTRRQPFTHWFLCPVTGDPAGVNMTIESEVILNQSAVNALAEAQQTGQYMVAIWRVQAGQLFRPYWMTNNFPRGDVKAAIEQLQNDMRSEIGDKLPPAELKPADISPLKVITGAEMPDGGSEEQDSEEAGGGGPEPVAEVLDERLLPQAVVCTPPVQINLDNE